MNSEFVKDISKAVQNTKLNQELPAGSTNRRYEPAAGVKKHNERIHKESKYADNYKNLPFSFKKPSKPIGRSSYVSCDNCGHIIVGTTATVGMICKSCGKFSSVSEVAYDE